MQAISSKRLSLVFVLLAPMVGCGSTEGGLNGNGGDGGTGATGGSGGTGGTPGVLVVLPQCISSAYQIVFRAFMEPMDPLLKYMDTPAGLRDAEQKPPIVSLTEDKTVEGVYSRFTWYADDVSGVEDSGETFITADFIESSGLNPANLDDGFNNQEVVILPWEMTVGTSTVVGKGRMSIVGLGEDSVRVTIIEFNPWYEGWANYCRFEISLFDYALDLTEEPGFGPYSAVTGFTAEGVSFTIDNGTIILGEGNTASFTGDFTPTGGAALPFELELDYSTDPAAITGTVGGSLPADCTIDLESFEVRC